MTNLFNDKETSALAEGMMEEIEGAARILCRKSGTDPDAVEIFSMEVNWRRYAKSVTEFMLNENNRYAIDMALKEARKMTKAGKKAKDAPQ